MTTSTTPYSTQFITYCTGGDAAPTAINIRRYLPEASDARLYVSAYTLRLAAYACEDQDVLDGRKLVSVRVNWSNATTTFPISNDRGQSSNSDINLTLNIQEASAAQLVTFEAGGLASGAKLSLFWDLTGSR